MKNLITEARELIEALHAGEYDDEYIGTGAYLMLDELCDALEKAQAEIEKMKPFYKIADDTFRHWENAAYAMRDDERKRHRWIPISDRFPMPVDLNQQGFVLGLFDNGDVDFCGGKEAQHITTLTHWMPLPAPPEEGAEAALGGKAGE